MSANYHDLGVQLREARRRRGLSQSALAARVGRVPPRISELERDLLKGRAGKDRLTLLMEICDALDLVPFLAPRSRVAAVREALGQEGGAARIASTPRSAFDDVFVDLGDVEE